MDDNRTPIYDAFEAKLRKELIKLCTEFEMMNGQLLRSDDIDAKWDEFVAEIKPFADEFGAFMQEAVYAEAQKVVGNK